MSDYPSLTEIKKSIKEVTCAVFMITFLVIGGIIYATGCNPHTNCYSSDKFTGVVAENIFESYDCTTETINGLTPYTSECVEYAATPSCRYSESDGCFGRNVYYKCVRYQSYTCFNRTIKIAYNGDKMCIVSEQRLITNTTDDLQNGSTTTIFIDDKNVCSFTSARITNLQSWIGFGFMMIPCVVVGVPLAFLLICCCCNSFDEKKETVIYNPTWCALPPVFPRDSMRDPWPTVYLRYPARYV